MKANPISSGLVNLLLCLHCGAFSRFCILWYCFCTSMLSCMCCHGNTACVNNRTCCMTGECNCACMPVQTPPSTWWCISLLIQHFLCFLQFFPLPLIFSLSFPPDTAFSGFFLLVVSFSFPCCVYSVCVLFCLPESSRFFYLFLTITIFCPPSPPSLFFVVHLCVRLVFLFPTDAALLVDSQSANANAE